MLARRPMLSFAAALTGGVVAARFIPDIERLVFCGWLFFLALTAWFLLTPRAEPPPPEAIPEAYRPHILARPGFVARRGLNRFVLVAGVGLFLAGTMRQDAWRKELSLSRLPEKRWFDATLLALSPRREHPDEDGTWRVPALLLAVGGASAGGVPVRLSGGKGADFRRGDVITARVRRETPPPLPYPGAFPVAFWLEREGLVASLFVTRGRLDAGKALYNVIPMESAPPMTRLRRSLDAVRAEAVRSTLARGGGSGGLLAAMLYGYRKDVAAEISGSFRRTGIGHVLAISGLHVGLIVGLLWWLSGWLGWTSRWRAAACLVLALLYLGLNGGQVAAVRATMMAVIHLAGVAWGRRTDMLNSLGASAFLIVCLNPSAPMDVSFQLSFTAVAFIHIALRRDRVAGRPGTDAIQGPAAHWRTRGGMAERIRGRAGGEIRSLVRLSVFTWFGLFPVIAMVFNQANPAGLPFNVAVIPLMSLVLAGGLLLPWLGWIPGLAALLTLPAELLTRMARWVDALPYSSLPCHAPAGIWIFAFYTLVFLRSLAGMSARGAWRRAACSAALAASLAGMAFSMRSAAPPPAGRLTVLPVRGAGMIVAESAEGGIGLVGTFGRGGLNEAGWLHHLRRSGAIGVAAVGRNASEERVSALAYHYPLAAFTPIASTSPPGAPGRNGSSPGDWLPLPGAAGVEYAVSRNDKGNIVWLAARTGGKSVCVAPRLTPGQLAWRLEHGTPGYDAGLMLLDFPGRTSLDELPSPPGMVGVSGRFAGKLPERWFARDAVGAVTLETAVSGFDGRRWLPLPPAPPAGDKRNACAETEETGKGFFRGGRPEPPDPPP